MGFDGFDGIEVVMDVEDTFGVAIPDKEAEQIRSAGELYEYVVRRVALVKP